MLYRIAKIINDSWIVQRGAREVEVEVESSFVFDRGILVGQKV